MFDRIENALIEVLQEHLKTVPRGNIGVSKPKNRKSLPAIHVENADFEVVDVGVGRSMGGEESRREDRFNGDGEKREFSLSEKPLRPVIVVEHPVGKRLSEEEYDVDYREGMVRFQNPPAEGKGNVFVRYYRPFDVKGLRLNLRYHLTIWAEDEAQRNLATVEVMETMLREESTLNQRGVFLKLVKGFNAPDDDELSEASGKTLEYMIETEFRVEVPQPRMERIEFQKLESGPGGI